MNVPLLLGIFAIVAFPVGLLFWIYDSAKSVKDYVKSPPERKQMTREFHKEALADGRRAAFTPFTVGGLIFLAVVVIVIAVGNR